MLTRQEKCKKIYEVIGPISFDYDILIGDILHYANVLVSNESEVFDYTRDIEDLEMEIIRHFTMYDIRRPIDVQTSTCINFIYSLIKHQC